MTSSPMKSQFFKSLRNQQIAVAIFVSTIFITVFSLAIIEENKNSVTLHVNGEEEVIKTHAKTVGKLLSDQEIEVAKHDVVTPSVDAKIEEGLSVNWEQAQEVAIVVDEEDKTVWTTKKTVGEVLEEAGIEITEHDELDPKPQAELVEDSKITVNKAYEFTLVDGTEEKKFWSTQATIDQFLEKEEIKLNEFDRIEGIKELKEDMIKPNSTVQIVRVEKDSDVVEEAAEFTIETKKDDSLLKGREKVVQEGKHGKIEKTFEIVKENGKEVSRTMVEETVTKKPTNKIVSVGTKVMVASVTPAPEKAASQPKATANTKSAAKPAATANKQVASKPAASKPSASEGVSVSRDDAAPSGGKEFYVDSTAYTPFCNGCSGITATGINLHANPNLKVIAVDPRVIPLGTKVWVEGYGYAVAGDTGGAIKGNRIDVLMADKSQAYSWGRKKVKIRVMN